MEVECFFYDNANDKKKKPEKVKKKQRKQERRAVPPTATRCQRRTCVSFVSRRGCTLARLTVTRRTFRSNVNIPGNLRTSEASTSYT